MKKKMLFLLILIVPCFIFVGCGEEVIVLPSYDLVLSYDETSQKLEGEMSLSYINNETCELDLLMFHVWPTGFDEGSMQSVVSLANFKRAYYDGKNGGEYNIISAKRGDKELEFEMIGDFEHMLEVKLDEPLGVGEKIVLNISFEAVLPKINHRYGVGKNSINFGNCFPILSVFEDGEWDMNAYHYNGDPFYSEMANFKMTLALNASYQLASSGVQNVLSYENGIKTVEVKAENVRDFAFVISKFEILEDSVDNIKIKYYYYNDTNPDESLKTAVKSVETFNELFGKYPYSTLSVVEASFVHGGMEFPNMVLISDDLGSYETYTTVIIHEIAHQWWYGVVGNDQFGEGWLDEGLAEFSVALFYDEHPEYNNSRQNMTLTNKNNYKVFEKVYTTAIGEIDTSFDRSLDEFGSEQEYVYTAYVKGYLLEDTLYEKLGKRRYLNCLKNYYKENMFKTATAESFIRAFGERELISTWRSGNVEIV